MLRLKEIVHENYEKTGIKLKLVVAYFYQKQKLQTRKTVLSLFQLDEQRKRATPVTNLLRSIWKWCPRYVNLEWPEILINFMLQIQEKLY